MQFDHIGVYVARQEDAQVIAEALGGNFLDSWTSEEGGLSAWIYDFSGTTVEFLYQPGRKELGLDHLAYVPPDFDQACSRILAGGGEEEKAFELNGRRLFFAMWNSLRIELLENEEG